MNDVLMREMVVELLPSFLVELAIYCEACEVSFGAAMATASSLVLQPNADDAFTGIVRSIDVPDGRHGVRPAAPGDVEGKTDDDERDD